jgi:hypothetical protein
MWKPLTPFPLQKWNPESHDKRFCSSDRGFDGNRLVFDPTGSKNRKKPGPFCFYRLDHTDQYFFPLFFLPNL